MRARNVGWDYRFYDDAAVSQFIRDAYGSNILARFERIDPRYGAARADVFRYLLAYHTGGVYLDIKSTASRPLDELLLPNDRLILAQWPEDAAFDGWGSHDWDFAGRIKGGEFQQWHVICAPGHPYMHAVINAVLRNIDCYIPQMHGCGVNAVLRLTGPIAYTIAMLPLLNAGLHRTAQQHRDLGLDYSMLPANADHKKILVSHYSKLSQPIVHPYFAQKVLGRLYTLYDGLRK
ncbi:glycosyltransferase family 32 protein [Pararoseomonas indoligenes]|uniref:Glycosyltransferase n=1 Tax=Roseomonas indoligenes TaxID=2820811 RepID=A0A940N257_9PROT|nr:glycosyltransferase [Pararoseomonas indoligenes]MBP0495848.1 hypothetical protein [Pararoseomonas indoligenes]